MIYNVRDRLKVIFPVSLRQTIFNARFAARMPTSRYRVLPDFLIIGAMRAGTSSLYRYLGMHPLVVASLRKETHFFSDSYSKGERWYRCHFPTRQALQVRSAIHGADGLTFEATPNYLFHPHAAARAAGLLPDAKLIVLLRNPADRAVSHYQHMVRYGYERRSFERALAEEPAMVDRERASVLHNPGYNSVPLRHFSYFSKGLYAAQLKTWMRYFVREQFLLLKSEDFFAQPAEIYGQVLSFLGLRQWQPAEFRNYSYWGARVERASANDVAGTVHLELARRYRPHNEVLYDLLGKDLGWDG